MENSSKQQLDFEIMTQQSFNTVPSYPVSSMANHKEAYDILLDLSAPADLTIAKKHSQARKVFKHKTLNSPASSKCPCCDLPLHGEKFLFWESNSTLGELGSSYPLFFRFSLLIVVALAAVFLIAGIPSIIDNWRRSDYLQLHGNDLGGLPTDWQIIEKRRVLKDKTPCEQSDNKNEYYCSGIFYIPLFDDLGSVSAYQAVSHCIMCLLLLVYYVLITYLLKRYHSEIEIENTDASNFSLLIKGLPKNYSKAEIKEHFHKYISDDIKIIMISSAYDIYDFNKTSSQLRDWEFNYSYIQKHKEHFGKYPTQKKCCRAKPARTLEQCQEEISKIKALQQQYFYHMSKNGLTSYAFITFRTLLEAREIANIWKHLRIKIRCSASFSCIKLPLMCYFKGKLINVKTAPHPTDVIWENLRTTPGRKVAFKIFTLFLEFLILSASFTVVYFMKFLANVYENNESNQTMSLTASIISNFFIVIFNILVLRITKLYSVYERHKTYSAHSASVLKKTFFLMFFNTIIIPALIYHSHTKDNFIRILYSLQLLNAAIPPIYNILSPLYLYKKYQQHNLIRQAAQGVMNISQAEANEIFEGPKVDLSDRFANTLKTFCLSLVYAPILPLGMIIGIFGVTFEAVVFKYLLINVHSRPIKHNKELMVQATQLVPWVAFFYSIGIYFFYGVMMPELILLYFSVMGFCFLFAVISTSKIAPLVIGDLTTKNLTERVKSGLKENDYFKYLPNLTTDYERENPVTHKSGLERFKNFVENNNEAQYLAFIDPTLTYADVQESVLSYSSQRLLHKSSYALKNLLVHQYYTSIN